MCGQSPLYVPTTVNAQIKNIDAVDVAATSISCTNLTVNGEPVSTAIQNVGSSTPGNTVFTGTLTADNLTTAGTTTTGAIVASSANITGSGLTASTITSTGTISALSVTATGDVSGATLTGTVSTPTQNSITKVGTQTSLVVSGSTTLASVTASSAVVNNSGTTTTRVLDLLMPSLADGQKARMILGKSAATNNSTVIDFDYQSTGSTSNGIILQNYNGTTKLQVTQAGVIVVGTLTGAVADTISGSITTGSSTFTTSAFPSGYGAYLIRWFNLGCSGNFTPYLQFAKTATATYSSGYRVTSDKIGYNNETATTRVTINPSSSGLANSEQMTGMIKIYKANSTTWFIEGWSQSSNVVGVTIFGTFVNPATGIDKITFGVTGGTLNATTATYQIVPVP